MKKKMTAILLLAAMALSTQSGVVMADAQANVVELFVAADGSDKNSGSIDQPFATLKKALGEAEAVKKTNADANISINIRGGEYYLNDGMEIGRTLSGTNAENPFIIQNYNDEEVVFKGAVTIDQYKFKQVKDASVLNRLHENARGRVGYLELSECGIKKIDAFIANRGFNIDSASTSYSNLFLDGREQQLARWPNIGYSTITEGLSKNQFRYDGDEIKRWTRAKDIILEGYFGVEYGYERIPCLSIDTATGTITSTVNNWYGFASGKRWAAFNLLEELDEPGEYYIDRETNTLYYWPPYSLAGHKLEMAMFSKPVFTINRAENITIKGIKIDNVRDRGFVITDCKNINIDGCYLNNIGYDGILLTNGKDCTIQNCSLFHIGAIGISIEGGDRQTLVPGNIQVINNHLYDTATKSKTYNPAIRIEGVGHVIEHNLIHESPHQGILFFGNNHKINYNEIYNVLKETSDSGAIYCGRNYTMRGNEIAYNYIHDIHTTAAVTENLYAVGIYLDDMFSSVNIHHNIFYDVNLAVMMGGGRDNNFDNNIMVNCPNTLYMDDRGIGWAKYHTEPGGEAYNTIFEVPYNKPPYSEQYPELVKIFDTVLGYPAGNSIQDNIMYNEGTEPKSLVGAGMYAYSTVRNNIEFRHNPGIKDIAGRNFEVLAGSEAAQKMPGTLDIKMSDIGLYAEKAAAEKERISGNTFRLYTPMNGQANVDNLDNDFKWDKVENADKYHFTLARDPEMTDIVISKDTKSNWTTISGLETGRKTYYWRVNAYNIAGQIGSEWQSAGKPMVFTTAVRDIIIKDELQSNIDICTKLYEAIVEGDAPGQYRKGYKDKVKKALDEAVIINISDTVGQADVIAANDKLTAVLSELGGNLNYKTVELKEAIADQKKWDAKPEALTFDNGVMTLSDTDRRIAGYRNEFEPNVVLKFDLNVSVGTNYMGLGFCQEDYSKPAFDSQQPSAYMVVIKSGQFEMQKYYGGKRVELIPTPNMHIGNDQWHTVEIGALETGIGKRLLFKVDGHTLLDVMDYDTDKPVKGNYFCMVDASNGGHVSIR